MMETLPTLVESPEFAAWADDNWTRDDLMAFAWFIANHPEAGEIIVGAGGVRKVRWTMPGRGKRGGSRVLYFYMNQTSPLFLLAGYAKAEKVDITPEQKRALKRAAQIIKAAYRFT